MALRYLAGKLRVPAGAALRRVEGSRGVSYRSSQGKGPSAKAEEELKRLRDRNAALICQIREASSYRQSYGTRLALCFSGGTILGVFIVSLILRYENRSGGKIGKIMCGIPTK